MTDIFGDLREWGQVLKQIEQLRLAGQLDEHQEGLVRTLRYRCNWQLRQAALRAVPELVSPSRDLLEVLLQIVTDESCDLETRLLACDAVGQTIIQRRRRGAAGDFESKVTEQAQQILGVPGPPVLRAAVERWLGLMGESAARPAAGASR